MQQKASGELKHSSRPPSRNMEPTSKGSRGEGRGKGEKGSPPIFLFKFLPLVTATMHEDTVKKVLLTDVRYYLLIYVSK